MAQVAWATGSSRPSWGCTRDDARLAAHQAQERPQVHDPRTCGGRAAPPVLRRLALPVQGEELDHLHGKGCREPRTRARWRSKALVERHTCVSALMKLLCFPFCRNPFCTPSRNATTSFWPIQAISRVPKNITGTSSSLRCGTLPSFFCAALSLRIWACEARSACESASAWARRVPPRLRGARTYAKGLGHSCAGGAAWGSQDQGLR